jgi:hypothetical protein
MKSPYYKKYSTIGFAFGLGLCILNFMDAFLTLWITKMEGGYHVELNPLMRALMENIGDWFWVPKLIVGFTAGMLMVVYWEKYSWFRTFSMVIVFTYVVTVAYGVLNVVRYHI